MPSNLTMAKAKFLIFSLFSVTLVREVPFGIPQYIQCILYGLISALLCVPFIFANSEKCRFSGCTYWLPLCNRKFSIFFILLTLIKKLPFQILFNSYWLVIS